MPYIAKAIFLLLSLVVATSSHGAGLTEETVKQVISRIDKAVNDQNANALANELSNDVSIKLNISMKGRKQAMTASKRQYISMLEQSWAKYSDYKYSRSDVKINIKDNKAFVSAVVQESMTVQGQNVSGSSTEEVTIEMVNGKPLITKVLAHISL
jgi:hypothetical protein